MNSAFDQGFNDYVNRSHLNRYNFDENGGHDFREWIRGYNCAKMLDRNF